MVTGETVKRGKLETYYAKDDYYFPQDDKMLKILGSGAELYGFDRLDIPKKEAFMRFVEGREVKAFDLPFLPPKGVSLLWALGSEEDRKIVLAAHRAGIVATLQYIEHSGFFRVMKSVRGVKFSVAATSMIALPIDHSLNRENEPLLHTHVLIANAGIIPGENVSRAVNFKVFFDNQLHLGAVYRSVMRAELEKSGFRTINLPRNLYDLADVTRVQVASFSHRSKQIEDNLARVGLTRKSATGKQRQQATLRGRKKKVKDIDPETLRFAWIEIGNELGVNIRRDVLGDPDVLGYARQRQQEILMTRAVENFRQCTPIGTRKDLVDYILRASHKVGAKHGNPSAAALTIEEINRHLPTVLNRLEMIRLPWQDAGPENYLHERMIHARLLDKALAEMESNPPRGGWIIQLASTIERKRDLEKEILETRASLIEYHGGAWSNVPREDRDRINEAKAISREILVQGIRFCQESWPGNSCTSAIERTAKKLVDSWQKKTKSEGRRFAKDGSRTRGSNHQRRQDEIDKDFMENINRITAQWALEESILRIFSGTDEDALSSISCRGGVTHAPKTDSENVSGDRDQPIEIEFFEKTENEEGGTETRPGLAPR